MTAGFDGQAAAAGGDEAALLAHLEASQEALWEIASNMASELPQTGGQMSWSG